MMPADLIMPFDCPICMQAVERLMVSRSGHGACQACVQAIFQTAAASGARPMSPQTRAVMDEHYYTPLYVDASAPVAVTPAAPAALVARGPPSREFVFILDVSGSMGSSSKNIANAPSRIGLMAHLVKALSLTLRGHQVTIMTFSSQTNMLVDKVPAGDARIERSLQTIRSSGGTNLAGALTSAIAHKGTGVTYVLFTDGEPDDGEEAIRRAQQAGEGLNLHVVGFGPSLDSRVMRTLSELGHGVYTYIYDVSTSSAMLSSLTAYLLCGPNVTLSARDETLRQQFLVQLKELERTRGDGVARIRRLLQSVDTDYSQALQEDLEHASENLGQISKAVRYLDSWGQYYLSAIVRAHELKCPTSDVERSLYFYRTPEFTEQFKACMRTISDVQFVPLTTSDQVSQKAVQQTIQASTAIGPDRSGGCFVGSAQVDTAHGTLSVCDLKKGMMVLAYSGGESKPAKVHAVIAIRCSRPIGIYGGFITAYHPVRRGEDWVFPLDTLRKTGVSEDGYVYNVLLEPGFDSITVNGERCLTLGHGLTVGIAGHPYFTDRVRDDIMRQPIHEGGMVLADLRDERRDENGLICSFWSADHSADDTIDA